MRTLRYEGLVCELLFLRLPDDLRDAKVHARSQAEFGRLGADGIWISMQLRGQVHQRLVGMLPALGDLALQVGLQLRDFMLLPFRTRLFGNLATHVGGLLVAKPLCKDFDEDRLVLRRHVIADHESQRGVERGQCV